MNSIRDLGFGSALAAFAVLATSFALGVTVATTVQSVAVQKSLQTEDQRVRVQLASRDMVSPLETQIAEREQAMTKLKDPVSIDEEKLRLAELYRQLGAKSEVLGRFAHAEMSLQRAAALTPNSPTPPADLGRLYAEAAQAQRDSEAKISLLQNSTESYREAAKRTPDPAARRPYLRNAAEVQNLLARAFADQGMFEAAEAAKRQAAQLSATR